MKGQTLKITVSFAKFAPKQKLATDLSFAGAAYMNGRPLELINVAMKSVVVKILVSESLEMHH